MESTTLKSLGLIGGRAILRYGTQNIGRKYFVTINSPTSARAHISFHFIRKTACDDLTLTCLDIPLHAVMEFSLSRVPFRPRDSGILSYIYEKAINNNIENKVERSCLSAHDWSTEAHIL